MRPRMRRLLFAALLLAGCTIKSEPPLSDGDAGADAGADAGDASTSSTDAAFS